MDKTDRTTAIIDYTHELTMGEKLQIGEKIAELDQQADILEGERKSAASGFKARLDENEQQRKSLSRNIRTGVEMRTGECELLYDYNEGVVNFRLTSNGITVYSREMTSEERQLNLFGK